MITTRERPDGECWICGKTDGDPERPLDSEGAHPDCRENFYSDEQPDWSWPTIGGGDD